MSQSRLQGNPGFRNAYQARIRTAPAPGQDWSLGPRPREPGVAYLERETFDAFLKLPALQRQMMREVLLAFAKVHGEG